VHRSLDASQRNSKNRSPVFLEEGSKKNVPLLPGRSEFI
jgi:hypothetical protein